MVTNVDGLSEAEAPEDADVCSLCAVLVLYKLPLEESASYRTLRRALSHVHGRLKLRLIIYDNSPEPQAGVVDQLPNEEHLKVSYHHNPDNSGLVGAYNHALGAASAQHQDWLLLLDQDSSLPQNYFDLFLDVLPWLDTSVVCVAPKVRIGTGNILSPRYVGSIVGAFVSYGLGDAGLAKQEIVAINSAAFVRVPYLVSRGGYPSNYWLDAVDLWFCADAYRNGRRIWVLDTFVDHELSTLDMAKMPLSRFESIFAAETEFHIQMRNRPARLFCVLVGMIQSGSLYAKGYERHARIRCKHAARLLTSIIR